MSYRNYTQGKYIHRKHDDEDNDDEDDDIKPPEALEVRLDTGTEAWLSDANVLAFAALALVRHRV